MATVCQVLHDMNIGGTQTLALRVARGLRTRYEFVFACLGEEGPLSRSVRQGGLVLARLEKRPGVDLRCARRLRQVLRAHHVDLVHAHHYAQFFYSVVARGPRARPPVLYTEHGPLEEGDRRPKRLLFNRLALGRFDRIVCAGGSLRPTLVRNEAFAPDRVGVIQNGAPVVDAGGQPARRARTRSALGLEAGTLVVVLVARLERVKDVPTAIRAIGMVARERPRVRLLVVGSGSERLGLEHLASSLGLQACVRFLGYRTDVEDLLAAADVFLLTSTTEVAPLALLEAMGAGLPVVATDVGGVPDIVVHGETGWLTAAGDYRDLALRIHSLLAEPERARTMGQAGRMRAQGALSETRMIAEYADLYDEMLRAAQDVRQPGPAS